MLIQKPQNSSLQKKKEKKKGLINSLVETIASTRPDKTRRDASTHRLELLVVQVVARAKVLLRVADMT